MAGSELTQPSDYADWLGRLKQRILGSQQRATLAVNSEPKMGAKVVERIAHDLRNAFPTMKGFSRSNLLYMRALAEAWRDRTIVQQLVGQFDFTTKLPTIDQIEAELRQDIAGEMEDE